MLYEWDVTWMQNGSVIARIQNVKAATREKAIDKARDIMYRRGYQPNYLTPYATRISKPLRVQSTELDAQTDFWYTNI